MFQHFTRINLPAVLRIRYRTACEQEEPQISVPVYLTSHLRVFQDMTQAPADMQSGGGNCRLPFCCLHFCNTL